LLLPAESGTTIGANHRPSTIGSLTAMSSTGSVTHPQPQEAGDQPMSQQPPPGQETLTPSVLEGVDQVCDSFESAWKTAGCNGPRPRIEDYLGDTPEPRRSALLRELIALDIDYRRQAGERPGVEEYQTRFPFLKLNELAT